MIATLLPSGLMDVLPPLAAAEYRLIHRFLKTFIRFGYEPVIPPLAEYESSLLEGQGQATSHHVFRVADPTASQMLALRADMTGQVARIASGALAEAPRPLRLCYAGATLRTTAEALKTRRQHTQVGIERFGDIHAASVAEVLAIAAHGLKEAGADSLTIDLHYPSALEALLADLPKTNHDAIREAVRLKDTAQLRRLGATKIADLLDLSGPAESTLARLKEAGIPALAAPIAELEALTAALAAQQVPASLTVDLLDLSGYGYYVGVGYAIYWNGPAIEAGRGGCYLTPSGEKSVGFTLYLNDLLDRLGTEEPLPLVALPSGTTLADALWVQEQGYRTVYAEGDAAALKAQGIAHRLDKGDIVPL